MSNYLAIATVSAALRKSLFDTIQGDVSGAQVTTVSPHLTGTGGVPNKGVNLFLYRVAPNSALRNLDAPARNRAGNVISRPMAALNLDYLFSFYGNETRHEPQQLLGITVRAMHSKPQLSQAMINSAVSDPANVPFLGNSDLAQQVELVKFSQLELSLEDMSKLWSVFLQTPYALSVAYRASVVLIDSKASPTPPLPVRDYSFVVFPANRPVIKSVHAVSNIDDPIVTGSQARVEGVNLIADSVQLQLEIGGQGVAPASASVNEIDFTVPANLDAGVQGVMVHHAFMQGVPPEAHRAMSSNLGTFVLHPQIAKQAGNYLITVSNVQSTGPGSHSADIKVKMVPAARDSQSIILELIVKTSGQVRTFAANANDHASAETTFSIPTIPDGSYLLRVRVDGAESGFDLDGSNQPVAPEVTIP